MKKDKAKVVDEVWDDARIESFLEKQAYGDAPVAFSQLLHAYRSMRLDDFEKFLQKFVATGGDVQSPNQHGQTLTDVISSHKSSAPFIKLLKASASN